MNSKTPGKSNKKADERQLRGIVRKAETKKTEAGGDETFNPDYTVTSTTDGGGKVLTDVEVILIFWGSFWTSNPAPTPSSDTYKTAIEGILTGPFMAGLRQYRGVGQGTLAYSEVYTGSDPSDLYTDSDVVNLITDRLNNNSSMPAPVAGHNRFYAVIAPKGIRNSLTGFAGQHQSFTYNGVKGYYAWVDNTGSLTGHDCTTKVFSHELVEACTNPDVDTSNNGILVNGTKADGTSVSNDEIGDTCNDQFFTLDMDGIQCSVQAYWSKADNICLLPTGSATFWVDKNTFGWDEVQDIIRGGGVVSKAFWVVVEGFSKDSFNALAAGVPVPTGAFALLQGIQITQNPDIDFENGMDPSAQQRIRIPFDITFTNPNQSDFNGSNYGLDAYLALNGNHVASTDTSTEFELLAGADPYFANIDPNQNNVFYLSQDLRVFTATPKLVPVPVPGGPTFSGDSPGDAYTYVQSLLQWLNSTYSDPGGTDPFTGVLPEQSGAYTGDSSVTPFTLQFSGIFPKVYNNYNFAIARLRLRGTAGPAGKADNVRVFFRLWTSQTADTDYQPLTTYSSTSDTAGDPGSPNVGAGQTTIPFFATGNLGANTDYSAGGVNNQPIEIPANPPGRDSIWVYYGCFLNLYDPGYDIAGQQVQAWLNGTHHCLVAQLAYDQSPLFVGETPETSNRLAQRNLQVTRSDNPGPASAHRIPQTFNLRPSAAGQDAVDELMIDWGAIPKASIASIYMPQVNASDILALASSLYPSNILTASDAHTIRCKVTGGVTYLPVPKGSGEDFAALFTIDLPTTVIAGQEFNIVVRRV